MTRPTLPTTLFAFAIVLVSLVPFASARQDPRHDAFEQEVRPILVDRCGSCHGPETQQASLRLDHISTILTGGDSGPALVPGDPEASRMIQAIRYTNVDLQMPPRARLPGATVSVLERWVKDGAYWPDEPAPAASGTAEVFDLEQRRDEHWSWRPIERPEVPVDNTFESDHPIDRFLGQSLKNAALRPAETADRATLLRRLSFDLTGLPPSPEEVRAFTQDNSEDAYERQVDRLLASPHYGERQARHWMDLFRFAETYGHEFDYPISGAWRYRDHIIRAFNEDIPLDQRIREHIAGDLVFPQRRNLEDDTDESVQATTHYFLHQATHSPVDPRQDEADRIDNQIEVLSKAFLGLTVSCARCHDHKFDAISTEDYYSFAGFLKSSRRQEAFLDPGRRIETQTVALERGQLAAAETFRAALQSELAESPERIASYLIAATSEIPAPKPASEQLIEALPTLEVSSGEYRRQELKRFPKSEQWRGRDHMWWTGGKPGDCLTLGVDIPKDGRYRFTIGFTQAHDYATVQVTANGQPIGDPVDLFDPDVRAKSITFDAVPLVNGQARLSFEITGANERAEKAYMVGLDWISIHDLSARTERAETIAAVAKQRGLDPTRLLAWADLADRLKKGEGTDKEHPLQPLIVDLNKDSEALARSSQSESKHPPGAPTHTLFEDFESGYDDWFRSGEAFRDRPTEPGEWIAQSPEPSEGDLYHASYPVTGRLTEGGLAHSGVLARKHQGALRSKTFIIEEPSIHYRLAGQNAQIRVIVDGYFMDVHNGLLFNGFSFGVNTGGQFRWHHQNVSKYIGHRAHIEILDHSDGFVAVDEIWFGKPETPTRSFGTTDRFVPGTDLTPGTAGAIAADFGDQVVSVRRALAREDHVSDQGIAIVDALFAEGLLFVPGSPEPSARGATRLSLKDLWASSHAQWQMANALPRPTRVLAIADGTGEDRHIYIRGQHSNLGPLAPRRFLTAVAGEDQAPITRGSGRLELAERILSPDNPFPARVAVNRTWHHLFGRGIVSTVDNFGVLGQPPTHPELLDWLADWFRSDAEWSEKGLIRLIVTSKAYQQSSTAADPRADESDPENLFLHRMNVRRMEGEAIRDAILTVSGQLDRKQFGPSVPIHLTEFMGGRGRPGRSGPLDGAGRRSVYVEVRRNFLSPMMLAFDTPTPFTAVGRRSVSNVPAQGLIMMNDPFVIEQARKTADSVIADAESDGDRIDLLFLRALARTPDDTEREALLSYVDSRAQGSSKEDVLSAWADVCHAVLNLKEFTFLR